MLPRDGPLLGGDLSIVSWNILSDNCTQADIGAVLRYSHVPPDDLKWETRCRRILEEVASTKADIICFQEVNLNNVDDLRTPLQDIGYELLLQEKDGPSHPTVNTTCWKHAKLELVAQVHRSRVLTTVLKDAQGRLVAVANCHLQGKPQESLARVKQLQSSLKQLEKLSHHGVVLVGDFNCELQTSACASYLAFGEVLPGVIEWGAEVPFCFSEVASHGYELSSAYPSNSNDFTFTIRGNIGFCGMLDQLWVSHKSLKAVGIRSIFSSETQRSTILAAGLPCAVNPSDHLPVGVVLSWTEDLKDFRKCDDLDRPAVVDHHALLEEIDILLANCPWSDEQKAEWELATTLPELPKRQKPTPEQLELLSSLKARKERLLAELSEDARQILQRVAELQKKAKKQAERAQPSK